MPKNSQNGECRTQISRILYVSLWSSAYGGSSRQLLEMLAYLDRKRFDPVVLIPEPGELGDEVEKLNIPLECHRMTSLSRKTCLRFSKEVFWYRKFLRRWRIRLVHFNTVGWRSSVAMSAKLARIPFALHMQNPVPDVSGDFQMRWADRIFACSEAVGRPIREHNSLASKLRTVHNAVDLRPYETGEDRMSEIGPVSGPIIGFVGQLIPRKGLRDLIEGMPTVLSQYSGALLVVLGCAPPGDTEYEQECRELVKQLQIESHVRFPGFRSDVSQWMNTFDVFALPTRSEPFGKVIIEAMAAGCPVVATNVGGIPEIICRPDLGTLVPVGDRNAMTEAIVGQLGSPALRREIGAAGASHVRANFGMGAMIRRVESVYDELLAS